MAGLAENSEGIRKETGEPDLSEPWDESDVVFSVEDKNIYANKTVLGLWSPVFKAMFKGNFKEKALDVIPLPGKKHRSVQRLLQICHGQSEDITDDSVDELLPLAGEYQMKNVLCICEKYLLAGTKTMKKLVLAKEYGLQRLEDECMKYVRETPLAKLKAEACFGKLITDPWVKYLSEKAERYEHLAEIVKKLKEISQFTCSGYTTKNCVKCKAYYGDSYSCNPNPTNPGVIIQYKRRNWEHQRLCSHCSLALCQDMYSIVKNIDI